MENEINRIDNSVLDPDLVRPGILVDDFISHIAIQLDRDFCNEIRQFMNEFGNSNDNNKIKNINLNEQRANKNFRKEQIIRKYQRKFIQLVKENDNITEEDLAKALYYASYDRVITQCFRYGTGAENVSFWVPWTIAGKILNAIKAGWFNNDSLNDRPVVVHNSLQWRLR